MKLLAIYQGNVVEIIKDDNKYYYTNSKGIKKQVQRSEFTFIA